jgi:hypothetical protein
MKKRILENLIMRQLGNVGGAPRREMGITAALRNGAVLMPLCSESHKAICCGRSRVQSTLNATPQARR